MLNNNIYWASAQRGCTSGGAKSPKSEGREGTMRKRAGN